MAINFWSYLLVSYVVLYLIRMLPLTLIRKEIKNGFLRSCLYYVPFVTLAVMIFPAIFVVTGSMWSGLAGFAVGVIIAFLDGNLFRVAIGACVAVFITELIIL